MPLPILTVAGDERAMGAQHGDLVRALGDFDGALAYYPTLPERMLSGGRRGVGRRLALDVLRPLLAAGLGRLDRARPDALRARTRAYLAALGRRPEDHARHLLAVDLAQNAIGILARLGLVPQREVRALASSMPGACSSFAAWGELTEDGRVLCGRNFDLRGIGVWDRQPVVVFCAPTDGLRYGFVTTRGADVPGITAFNEAGLTVAAHTRFHRRVTFDGLGVVDLGHLIARRARSIADAIAIASEARIASSWGLFVSSGRERTAVSIEVHADRVAVVPAAPGRAFHTCTNRYRAPIMTRGEVTPSPAWVRYSEGRQEVMERALGRAARITPRDAMSLLASREAGDVPLWQRSTGDTLCQSITVQSVVFDPDGGRLWIGRGAAPASLGPWTEVPWRWDGPAVSLAPPGRAAGPPVSSAGAEAPAAWPGYDAFMEAARLEGEQAAPEQVAAALGCALAEAPDDPSYRQLAGGCALRAGHADEAIGHFERALAAERSPFRRRALGRWLERARDVARRARRPTPADLTVDFQLLTLDG